jgi:hypothetical protein
MDKPRTELPSPPPASRRLLWGLVLLTLLGWHGWLTLGLFGHEQALARLASDEPLVSGRHPLHLYHGYLGASALRERGTSCCYDPAFQAGYPKTPVFDVGSRPAELFLTLAGGEYHPAAYKIGLAICCLLVPVVLLTAARGAGLSHSAAALATTCGLFIWWGKPCQELLAAGDLDLLLGGLAALLCVGMLIRFHTAPRVTGWLGIFCSGCLGWFAQPLLFAGLLPLTLVYYLSVGAKHRFSWHFALLGGLAAPIAINMYWLLEWLNSWCLRSPLQLEGAVLQHRTWHTIWTSSLWGSSADRLMAVAVLVAGLIGLGVLNQTKQRPAARLLGLGCICFLLLAIAGVAWEPVARLGMSRLLVLALWFAALPAAHALAQGLQTANRLSGSPLRGAALSSCLLGLTCAGARESLYTLAARFGRPEPLRIGLSPSEQNTVALLTVHSSPEARILWEDEPDGSPSSHWTALLPMLSERAFLGGLDPETSIEHAVVSLTSSRLMGRPLADWSNSELEDFSRLYNVGWVVCRSSETAGRFLSCEGAKLLTPDVSATVRSLIQLQPRSYVLRGQGRLIHADFRYLALADVVPDADGCVVLSMHYQHGFRASPERVQIEKESDANDPIPFIRLRMPNPVARLTLTWHEP